MLRAERVRYGISLIIHIHSTQRAMTYQCQYRHADSHKKSNTTSELLGILKLVPFHGHPPGFWIALSRFVINGLATVV
jgi:hypothetical protein